MICSVCHGDGCDGNYMLCKHCGGDGDCDCSECIATEDDMDLSNFDLEEEPL